MGPVTGFRTLLKGAKRCKTVTFLLKTVRKRLKTSREGGFLTRSGA